MRILLVTQYFHPETFRINEMCRLLHERGHTVTVLTGVPNYPAGVVFPAYRDDPESFATFHGSRVVRVPMTLRGTRRWQLLLNYLTFAVSAATVGPWRLRGRRFDVILVHQASPVLVGLPAAVLRRLKRAPSAMWVLDLWPESPHALGLLPHPVLYGAMERVVRAIYRRTDHLLVQSPGFLEPTRRLAPEGTAVDYLPSWADAVFDDHEAAPAPEVPQAPGTFDVLFAGNIGEAQDFGTVLAAAAALADRGDVRFLVVGDGRRLAWVEAEVARRGLTGSVLLLGRHPVERMPEFFAHADALLVTLRPDPVFSLTIPAKVQAYMASGQPIVAVLDGEGAAAVRRWGCGLVTAPGDVDGLVRAVTALADASPEERAAMGARGREAAATEFDRHRLLDQLEDCLAGLAQPAEAVSA